jgi:hypothetical protein
LIRTDFEPADEASRIAGLSSFSGSQRG